MTGLQRLGRWSLVLLLTVHHPITDARTFFPDHLGRAFDYTTPGMDAFIRSAGGRTHRWMGSDSILAEDRFLRLFRRSTPVLPGNRTNDAANRIGGSYIRYYQLDEAAGRLEVGLQIRNRGRTRRLEMRDLLRLPTDMRVDIGKGNSAPVPLQSLGSAFARILQDKTRRHGGPSEEPRSVFHERPAVFVQGRTRELLVGDGGYPIETRIEGVELNFGYLSDSTPVWIITHDSAVDGAFDASRRLRQYLSRIHTQVGTHLGLLRRFPTLCESAGAPHVDAYTQYLNSSRKFIRRVDEKADALSGSSFIDAALTILHQTGSPTAGDVSRIIAAHEAFVTRGNIIQGIRNDLQTPPIAPERRATTNFNFNFFGSQRRIHQTIVEPPAAHPRVEMLAEALERFHQLVRTFASSLSQARVAAIEEAVHSIRASIRGRAVSGPFVLNAIDRMADSVGDIRIARAEIAQALEDVRDAVRL